MFDRQGPRTCLLFQHIREHRPETYYGPISSWGEPNRDSQDQLAERSGVSRPTISRIERAQVDVGIDVIARIADALGMPIADLFIPAEATYAGDEQLAARASPSDDDFVDADALLDAIDEAHERPAERYSRAGRPPVAR